MRPSEARDILERVTGRGASPARTAAVAVAAAGAGIVAGWILHNTYWYASDIDYALSRAMHLAANCKGIDFNEQRRRVEERLGKPLSLAKLDDKLIAIDYAFDKIEVSRCVPR